MTATASDRLAQHLREWALYSAAELVAMECRAAWKAVDRDLVLVRGQHRADIALTSAVILAWGDRDDGAVTAGLDAWERQGCAACGQAALRSGRATDLCADCQSDLAAEASP